MRPGSSPLARGLHGGRHPPREGCGIIPARAGFTFPPLALIGSPSDHPRSRGVYRDPSAPTATGAGSSPLARGLLQLELVEVVGHGIIPARAGFTPRPPDRRPGRGDHPRSRGVYNSRSFPYRTVVGSSPLARGLHVRSDEPGAIVGIIPARAGFTCRAPGPRWSPQDHPRSRGVYVDDAGDHRRTLGSSPLARGLRRPSTARCNRFRIIPARAGFTVGDAHADRAGRDHPRSRGVYFDFVAYMRSGRGSSPLARGLHWTVTTPDGYIGIIPARAGFTGLTRAKVTIARDHPRSRGVYPPTPSATSSSPGSSPLARGLPRRRAVSVQQTRIIPARAGFTRRSRGRSELGEDHPRSRGVYGKSRSFDHRRRGSSPLARGLRHRRPRQQGLRGSSPLARGLQSVADGPGSQPGIIPARAGFTKAPRPDGIRAQDHPRSRGVYSCATSCSAPGPGSSPLARGLRA